jgi:hypothetical protein
LSSKLPRITAADDHSCDELDPLSNTQHKRETEDRPSKVHPPNPFTHYLSCKQQRRQDEYSSLRSFPHPQHVRWSVRVQDAPQVRSVAGRDATRRRCSQAGTVGLARFPLRTRTVCYSSTPRPAPETSLSDDGRSHRGNRGLVDDPLQAGSMGLIDVPEQRSHVASWRGCSAL